MDHLVQVTSLILNVVIVAFIGWGAWRKKV
ncbi:hypothetical protein VMF7928_01898 [Vibrio marisflavi CECT 7928]|uniref:Uncharacterized protein n=1 Tax=Vibrio marisflavi CECT 7928 TaxID=634439 RepID=A0ABM9A3K6_9VIBR|nr:hypothetical protein VMF7928_01898 [Vibrio marisflavi CECT 7928]